MQLDPDTLADIFWLFKEFKSLLYFVLSSNFNYLLGEAFVEVFNVRCYIE